MGRFPLFEHALREEAAEWTVSELTARIKLLLEGSFGPVGVVGEVADLKRHSSGHVYFNLKDAGSSVRTVIWRSSAARLVFRLENGLAVRVRGELSVYAPRGEYSLVVHGIAPEGIGPLELAYRQLSERLAAEGLFDPERKRPLPDFPRRVLVVTSPTGAAVRDFLQVVHRRWPAVEVLIVPSRVQGAGAEHELVAALELANSVPDADLVVLARGGGSLEDLWPFNTEILARAIAASDLPVVSAIGHEVDVTIADRVADVRAATPSEAAERCVPDAAELRLVLDRLVQRLAPAVGRPLLAAAAEAEALDHRLHQAALRTLAAGRSRMDRQADRLAVAARRALDLHARRLGREVARLEALSPLAVLARGYSLTQLEPEASTGTRPPVLRDAAAVRPGARILTRLARGTLVSRVESVRTDAAATRPAAPPPDPEPAP